MNLSGCFAAEGATHGDSGHSFATMVLTVWTLCLGAYTWWWLRNPHTWNTPQVPEATPQPMACEMSPVVQDGPSEKGAQVEGLMLFALQRVLGGLSRARSQQRQHHEVLAEPVMAC